MYQIYFSIIKANIKPIKVELSLESMAFYYGNLFPSFCSSGNITLIVTSKNSGTVDVRSMKYWRPTEICQFLLHVEGISQDMPLVIS